MSFFFDGTTTNRITVPNSADMRFGTGDFTIEWWGYPRTGAISNRTFSFGAYPSATLAHHYQIARLYGRR